MGQERDILKDTFLRHAAKVTSRLQSWTNCLNPLMISFNPAKGYRAPYILTLIPLIVNESDKPPVMDPSHLEGYWCSLFVSWLQQTLKGSCGLNHPYVLSVVLISIQFSGSNKISRCPSLPVSLKWKHPLSKTMIKVGFAWDFFFIAKLWLEFQEIKSSAMVHPILQMKR